MQFRLLQKHTQEEFRQNAMVTSNAVKNAIEQDDYKLLKNLMSDLNKIETFEFVAIIETNEDGKQTVFACNPESFKNKVIRKDTLSYYYSSKSFESELLNGEVVIASSKAKDLLVLKELNKPLIYLTIVAVLASTLLFGFSIALVSRPIFKSVEIAKALGRREYSVEINEMKGKNEISSLNNSLFLLKSDLQKFDNENRELLNKLEAIISNKNDEIDVKNKFNDLLLGVSRIFLENRDEDKNIAVLSSFAKIAGTLNYKYIGIFSVENNGLSCQYNHEKCPLFNALKDTQLKNALNGIKANELLHITRGSADTNALYQKIFSEITEANSFYLKLFKDSEDEDELLVIISERAEKEIYFNDFDDMINVYFSLYRNYKRSKSFQTELVNLNKTLENKVLEKTKINLEISNSLIAQDKLATIGELSAGVAHDLNTPLAAVKAASQNINGVMKLLFNELKTLSKGDLEFVLSDSFKRPEASMELGAIEKMKKSKEIQEFLKTAEVSIDRESFARNLLDSGLDVEDLELIQRLIKLTDPLLSLKIIKKLTELNLFLNVIDSSVNRSAQVVQNLSLFTREDLTQKREPVDIHKSIEITKALFKFRLTGKIELTTNIEPNTFILGVEMKLFQVWTNIVKNAIDAFEDSEAENKYIRIYSEIVNKNVLVHFENNGPMISNENIQRIFKKFYTTKQSTNGTGLGLSIVSNIVAEHYGKISLTSDESKTIFTLSFPQFNE